MGIKTQNPGDDRQKINFEFQKFAINDWKWQ